jgi:hypothetical protein
VSEARAPSLSSRGPIEMPFVFVGTMTSDLFMCTRSSLVFTSRHSQSACDALVIHIFEPLMT